MVILFADNTRELEISATEAELQELASKVVQDGSIMKAEQEVKNIAPYSRNLLLISIQVIPGTTVEFKVSQDNMLVVTGGIEKLSVLSEAISAFRKDGKSGDHMHIEYFEDHYYLSPHSIPVVVSYR